MVTSINLGNFSNQNGRTIITGSSSGGIDTESLIESLSDAKRLPAVQLEERITSNTTRSTAYGSLRTLLSDFQSAADFLRNPPGVGNDDENIFQYRGTTLGGNTSGAASNYLSVTAQPGADISSYDVTIDQLATYNTKITETFSLADADTDAVGAGLPFNVGTLTLGASAVDVEIEADDTLNQIVAKINAVSNQSFVRASIIQVDDGEFRLSLKTTKTGSDYNYELTPIYTQNGNEISIEAEAFQASTARGGRSWGAVADGTASGGQYIEAGPNTGAFITTNIETTSPQVDYDVRFDQAGTYYVWVSGRGNSNDDTMHIGLDGAVEPFANGIFGFTAAGFTWSNVNLGGNPTRITVDSAGRHTLNVYMREDGLDVDRIVISSNASYNPNVNGVPASTLSSTASVFNVAFAVEEDATDAQITVDGTTVTRSSNSIDDVIDGVTFSLLSETGAGEELTVNVEADTDLAKTAITNFVDAYNELRIFFAEQTETDEDGVPTEDAVLSGSSTMRTILSRINAEVASIVDGISSGNYDRLADIGLNFSDYEGDSETPFVRNILVIDETKLDSALAANFDQVRALFEFDYISDDPDLAIFSRTNDLSVTEIELNIDQTNGIYQATYTDPTTSALVTVTLTAVAASGGLGVVLTAPDSSKIAGLTLIYANSGDAVVNLTLTQGIGDRVYNALEDVLDDETGLLTTEIESIADSNSRLQDEIDRIDEIVERFREKLILQYSALEAAISQANVLLQSLQAQADARNSYS